MPLEWPRESPWPAATCIARVNNTRVVPSLMSASALSVVMEDLGSLPVEGCDGNRVGGCERHTDEQCRTPDTHANELVQNPGDTEGGHDDQQGSGEDNAADAGARFTP